MRHKVFGKKLNRDVKERKALFKSLATALIKYGRIQTTIAKAKAVAPLIERLVTHAKEKGEAGKRQVTSFLAHKDIINKLIFEISPVFQDIAGGYTRIRRVGRRIGDGAEMVLLEWSREIKTEAKTDVKKNPKREKKAEKKKEVLEKKPKSRKMGKITI